MSRVGEHMRALYTMPTGHYRIFVVNIITLMARDREGSKSASGCVFTTHRSSFFFFLFVYHSGLQEVPRYLTLKGSIRPW
jgi:hypothetical protein